MLEQMRDYAAAITQNGASDPLGAQEAAITWAVRQHRAVGGTILVFVPQKASLHRSEQLIAGFAKSPGVVVGTWRGRVSGWSGGPVLAAWPSTEKLAEIADDHRTRALCVIPWLDRDTEAWERATAPTRLDGTEKQARAASLDPVVVVGLTHLTRMVNHGNNLVGAYDHRDAVAVLRTLHKAHYALPAEEVYAWALSAGWPARGALRLRDMAAKIDAGRTVQMKGASPLRSDMLSLWRAEARDKNASDQAQQT